MARKKLTRFHQFLIVGGVLALAQLVFLYIYSEPSTTLTAKDAIKGKDAPIALKRQLQIAINDFRSKNKKLPSKLEDLIPKYFDSIPIDPATKKPFEYTVQGTKFFIGGSNSSDGGPALGSGTSIKEILSVINDEALKKRPPFDPEGKRDPFRPYDPNPSQGVDLEKQPLEAYSLDSLRLTAVIETGGEPSANIEAPDGSGYIVKKGMRIGQNQGEIVEIKFDRLVILEKSTDFAGQDRNRTVELVIRTGAKTIDEGAARKK